MMHLLRFLPIIAAALLVFAPPARAQVAPEGNAHPDAPMLADAAPELANPFGEPDWAVPETDPRQARQAFAKKVDLSPLRDLAVQHGGRVKILDTLARETVLAITGKDRYQDVLLPGTSALSDKPYAYDPLFTLFDIMIVPGTYFGDPLIHVEQLNLRRQLLDAAFPGSDPDARQERETWLRLTRVSPKILLEHGPDVFESDRIDPELLRAQARLNQSLELLGEGWRNLLVVVPPTKDEPWLHLSQLPEFSLARVAAADLADAWRRHDAQGVNKAAHQLAAELPAINTDVYPTTRRSLEVVYNNANTFEWGMWVYFLSFVALILAFATSRRWLAAVGIGTLLIAVALHAVGFVLRCIIAERFAIQNQFESMIGVSLFAALVGAAIMLWKRQWLFGAAAAGTGFLVLITATQTGIPGKSIDREAAILNTSVLLKYHVTTVLTSYGLIALGMIVSLFFLTVYYTGSREGKAKLLSDLDKAQMTVLQLAFWVLPVGILLGAWWADHSWGRWWAFDPKETFALVTWIIYLIAVHVRFAMTGPGRAVTTAWLSVVGFIAMVWCYFGVNLLLPGLHAYA